MTDYELLITEVERTFEEHGFEIHRGILEGLSSTVFEKHGGAMRGYVRVSRSGELISSRSWLHTQKVKDFRSTKIQEHIDFFKGNL